MRAPATRELPACRARPRVMEAGMQHAIQIEGTPAPFRCDENRPVLAALLDRGSTALAVGCRSGGCGVCRVRVLAGRYETAPMSREQVSEADERDGLALACCLYPRSDLRLRAMGRRGDDESDAVALLIRRLSRRAPPPSI